MKYLNEIINSIDGKAPAINPTIIYNEGWMTRLLVKKSIEEGLIFNNIDFNKIRNWTSEALISSPFINAPINKEGYTHADIALGDFNVDFSKRGQIQVNTDAKIFGIIEAKMKSNLSQGTKYAKDYNQASRNVACIAINNLDIDSEIFFTIVGPQSYIEKNDMQKQVASENIYRQIEQRFEQYDDNFLTDIRKEEVLKRIKECRINVISYEDWIALFSEETKDILSDFYEKAKLYNRI